MFETKFMFLQEKNYVKCTFLLATTAFFSGLNLRILLFEELMEECISYCLFLVRFITNTKLRDTIHLKERFGKFNEHKIPLVLEVRNK